MFFGEKMKTKNLTLVVIGSTCGTFLKLAFERIADWDEKERKKERKREREKGGRRYRCRIDRMKNKQRGERNAINKQQFAS